MPPTVTEYNLNLRQPARPATAPKRPDPCADDKPACPACGGLQCLCRPRFFPGQLLTDEDLNRLERYVVDKNKLHNRYLHGWGVACGLEVACDPCSATHVVVRTGYALSPCGDDIVVCKDHSVNVCELIDQCRPQRGVVCDPPQAQSPRECRDGTEDWVLAICYDERPTRGITALTGSTDSACCSSCACGGSGSCGCKGGSSCTCGTKAAPTTSKKKAYKPQCEPTQICEGYRFTAYPKPKDTKVQAPGGLAAGNRDLLFAWIYANRAKFGPMVERLLCCVTAALQLRESFASQKYPSGREAHDAYMEYLDALRDFATTFAVHNCALLEKLLADTAADLESIRNLRAVAALGAAHEAVYAGAVQNLDRIVFDLIAECFCSALLPACPEPAPDNCVPLAMLTVRTRDCRVVEICNWEARKLLITWSTVGYWLSWLPWDRLRANIARLCCAPSKGRGVVWPLMLVAGVVLKYAATASTATKSARMATPESEEPLKKAMAAPNLMEHLAKGFDGLRAGTEAEAPEWASLLARMADGSALAPLAGGEAAKQADFAGIGAALGVESLSKQIGELRAKLADYDETLNGMKILMRGKGG